MSTIYELSSIATAIDINSKFGTIIGKAAANYGVTTTDLADDIRTQISRMTVGDAINAANWYFDAHCFATYLSETYGVTVNAAAGVISAVSPRMPWLRNKFVAESILANMGNVADLDANDAAKELGLGLSANVGMAIKIARGANISETLSGIKRRSFYNNIVAPRSDCNSVTVDTWMMETYCNVAGTDKATALKFVTANEKALKGTGAGYFLIADAVRIVANEMSIKPHQVQSLYWVCATGSMNGGREDIS